MRYRNVFPVSAMVLLGACTHSPKSNPSPPAPMLDGDCAEYSDKLADLSGESSIYVFQDAKSVWLCVTMLEGSYPSGEITLKTRAAPDTLVLHVSAQLGQWRVGATDDIPQNPTSDKWWNNVGWTALTPRFNGLEESEGELQPKFLPTNGQEFQFSKDVFGTGTWQIGGGFWSVRSADGDNKPLSITADADETISLSVF